MSFGNNPDAQTNNSQRVLDEMNSSTDNLSQLNPQFKVPDINNLDTGMDAHAPEVKDLKVNEKREVKQPFDRFAFPDLKEILKVRSAMVITALWVLNYFLIKMFANGHVTQWHIIQFNPAKISGYLGQVMQAQDLFSQLAGLGQVFLASIFAPWSTKSIGVLIINVIFLFLICWSAKFIRVDDVRLLKSYILCSFGATFITFGLYRLVVLIYNITGVSQGTWVQTISNASHGVYGLQIGLIGLWAFVLMQLLFERGAKSKFEENERDVRKRQSLAFLAVLILGVIYIILCGSFNIKSPVSLKIFTYVLLFVSLVLGVIRGTMSYYSMALRRFNR